MLVWNAATAHSAAPPIRNAIHRGHLLRERLRSVYATSHNLPHADLTQSKS
jgi:hypothetical protein